MTLKMWHVSIRPVLDYSGECFDVEICPHFLCFVLQVFPLRICRPLAMTLPHSLASLALILIGHCTCRAPHCGLAMHHTAAQSPMPSATL
jgi:hypothetical protein